MDLSMWERRRCTMLGCARLGGGGELATHACRRCETLLCEKHRTECWCPLDNDEPRAPDVVPLVDDRADDPAKDDTEEAHPAWWRGYNANKGELAEACSVAEARVRAYSAQESFVVAQRDLYWAERDKALAEVGRMRRELDALRARNVVAVGAGVFARFAAQGERDADAVQFAATAAERDALRAEVEGLRAQSAERDAAERVHASAYAGSVVRREAAEQERDALRAHLCTVLGWAYDVCDQTIQCPQCNAVWWNQPEEIHENWHGPGCEIFAAEVASGRSVDVRHAPVCEEKMRAVLAEEQGYRDHLRATHAEAVANEAMTVGLAELERLRGALREALSQLRSRVGGVPWCIRCGDAWDHHQVGAGCPAGRALAVLRGAASTGGA